MTKTVIPKVPSRPVVSYKDVADVAAAMQALLERGVPGGSKLKKRAVALHHSQVEADEPYNFFVVRRDVMRAKGNEIVVVVNPRIIGFSTDRSTKLEGCLSFPFRPDKKVLRHEAVRVIYEMPDEDGDLVAKEEEVDGLMAQVFQHEAEHAQGRHIY